MSADASLPPTADRIGAALATRWLGRAYEWHPVVRVDQRSSPPNGRARARRPA